MAGAKAAVTTEAVATAVPSNGHRLLTLEDIRGAAVPYEDVPVPEWHGSVRLYAVAASERARLIVLGQKEEDELAQIMFQAEVVAAAMRTEDVAAISAIPGIILDRLSRAAMLLLGLGTEAVEKATADLKATPNGESGSA